MKMQNKHNEKQLFITTIAVICAVIIYTSIIEPQAKQYSEKKRQAQQLRLKLTKMKADILIKDRIDQTYSQIGSLIKAIGTDQQEISLFSREIEGLVSKSLIKPGSVTLLPIIHEPHYRKLTIKLKTTDDIRKIASFINALESFEKPIRIEKIDLTAKGRPDNVTATIVLTKIVSNYSVRPSYDTKKPDVSQ